MPDSIFNILKPEQTSAYELLASKLAGKSLPWEIMFEITQKCNLRCTHCYNFDRTTTFRPPHVVDELSTEEIFRAIDEVIEAGCWNLCFTGGEALVHPDIFKFIERARSQSIKVSVKTNGILLTPERVKRLADLGVHRVWVSLYGSDKLTHDVVTAVDRSFEKTMKGCEEVVKAGMQLSIASVLTNDNIDQVTDLDNLAKRLNADFIITPEVTARHDGTDSSLGHVPTPEKTRQVFTKNADLFVYDEVKFDPNRFMQCSCALQSCAITATGDVYPCINAPMKAGNIRDASFQEIWDNSPLFERIRSLKHTDFKDCQSCEDKSWCGRSSGTVYTNTGDYLGTDPVTCSQAKIRREVWEEKHGKVDVQEKYREFVENQDADNSDKFVVPVDCPI
jgi:radical SAM protein with 4Fe4S-binding SPASM domain